MASVTGPFMRLLWALVLLSCAEPQPSGVSFDPQPNTTLQFPDFEFGKPEPEPRVIRVFNHAGPVRLEVSVSLPDFDVSQDTMELDARGTDSLLISFRPLRPGAISGQLDIGEASYVLEGSSHTCTLAFEPETVLTSGGQSSPVTIRALSSCTLEAILMESAAFELQNVPSLPVSLEKGEAVELRIKQISAPPRGQPKAFLVIRDSHNGIWRGKIEGQSADRSWFDCLERIGADLQFPETRVGARSQLTTRVVNHCVRDVPVQLEVTGSEAFSAPSGDLTVPAGAQASLQVSFAPSSTNDHQGQIAFIVQDGLDHPRPIVRLHGRGVEGYLAAYPEIVEFPPTPVHGADGTSCQVARELRVRNRSDLPVVIRSMSTARPFTILDEPAVPLTLVPDAELVLSVGYSPNPTGPEHGTLDVAVNEGTARINLLGASTPALSVTETFVVSEPPKVDVLWIVDSSLSAAWGLARLRGALPEFFAATGTTADLRMGVTEADGSGRVTECTERSCVLPGVDGALTYTEIDTSLQRALSAGLWRPDAVMAVVVVTDVDEDSDSIEWTLQTLQAYRGVGSTRVYAIAGPVNEPCFNRQSMQPAIRLAWLAERTSGFLANYCLEDWSEVLRAIAKDAVKPRTSWPLRYLPQSLQGYDEASGSLLFAEAPPPGMFDVTFDLRCHAP